MSRLPKPSPFAWAIAALIIFWLILAWFLALTSHTLNEWKIEQDDREMRERYETQTGFYPTYADIAYGWRKNDDQ